MDPSYWWRTIIVIVLVYAWIVFWRKEKMKLHYWIFFAIILAVLPWTYNLGIIWTFVLYFAVYYIARQIEKLVERRRQ